MPVRPHARRPQPECGGYLVMAQIQNVEEVVEIIDHPKLQDGPSTDWPPMLVASVVQARVYSAIAAHTIVDT